MLEMYDPEKEEDIDFDLFDTDHDRAMRFKNSLVCFSDVENHFFYTVIYGIMHLPNGILSLPFGHLSLKEIDEYKKSKGQRIEEYFWAEKENLLELEKTALTATPCLDFLNTILLQKPKVVSVDCAKFDRNLLFLYKEQRQKSILDFILCAGWKENLVGSTSTMESFKETFL